MIPSIPGPRGPLRSASSVLIGAIVWLACLAPVGSAIAAGPAAQLVVLSTTDVKGMTGPCGCSIPKGGLSRRAAFTDSMRSVYPNVMLVDNGGFFPDDAKRVDAGWFLMDMMSYLDMKAVGMSPSELRLGVAPFLANVQRTGLPITSANLVDAKTGKPVLAPWVVATSGDLKVGFFSLMSDTADLGRARDTLKVLPPVETARATVAELRKQGVTVIVLLSQLGRTGSEDLVGAVPGIDGVVCGRNVPLLPVGHVIGKTVASYGGEQGHYLSRMLFDLGADGRVTSGQCQCFALTNEVGEKESVAKMVKTFEDALAIRTGSSPKPAAGR
jgi:2',3'-cyclic-nucleotide 2'-phosphodiesterase (5'-nucleotidase family)